MMNRYLGTFVAVLLVCSATWGAPANETAAAVQAVEPSQARTSTFQPTKQSGVEWVRVPFEKAENELLSLVKRDLPEIERKTAHLVLYEVQTNGPLPQDFSRTFRSKLEKVLLMGKTLKLKDCPSCDESRLIRSENGQLRFESRSADPGRITQTAAQLGVSVFAYAEVSFTPEDLQLRLKIVDTSKNEILWSRDYSTEEYLRDRDGRFRLDPDGPGDLVREGDSLSHVMLGEIAFTMVLAPGAMLLPSIDRGEGSESSFYPSVDLMIGERYNRGYNRFGFMFGGAINAVSGPSKPKGLAFLGRVGPNFRHTFNPYNVSSARYSMVSELGIAVGPGVTTPYLGIGAEIGMMKRFSVTLMPMYFLTADVASDIAADVNGEIVMGRGPVEGRFGGFAFLVKGNINW